MLLLHWTINDSGLTTQQNREYFLAFSVANIKHTTFFFFLPTFENCKKAMSTLNSFFRARKSRNTSINKEKTLKCVEDETKQQFAAQIPQPIYEVLPKPQTTMKTGSRNNVKKKNSQDKNKNSILYYLSPVKDITHTTEEAAPLCQIRHNIPANYVWNLILEEFDPQSQSNQFEGSPCPSPTIEKADLHTVNEMTTVNSRRRKLEQEEQDTYRVISINTFQLI